MPCNVEAAACTGVLADSLRSPLEQCTMSWACLETGDVLLAGSQRGMQPTPSSRPTIKVPAFPLARELGGSAAKLGRTDNATHCEQVEEKSSKPLQAAAAVAAQRRLGGGGPSKCCVVNNARELHN